VGGVLPIDSEMLFVTDFVNVKIKLAQCFGGAHRSRVYVRVFIGMRAHMCMSICVRTVFLKKHCSKKDDKTVVLFLRFSFLSFFQQYRSRSHVDQEQIRAGHCSAQYRSNRSIFTWIRSRRFVTPFLNVEEILRNINGSMVGPQGEPPCYTASGHHRRS
jgi:hypothetical protein